ncbi:hypothetical protein [Verrucomicrobium spinosum]|uniref:hypothetical protein n=1 Tax=Verrucomicrobium spinosum TaxID=2736 RepID=UPI000174555C|nr:hypothetical protein [Verrucomicrobium spinosum]
MSLTELSTARSLLSSYCELCDAVIENVELRFGLDPELNMLLVVRTNEGVPCRVTLRLSSVEAFRFEFLEHQSGKVISEGVRVDCDGDSLFVDFGDDPDLRPGEAGWQVYSKKWCVCAALDIVDVQPYSPS